MLEMIETRRPRCLRRMFGSLTGRMSTPRRHRLLNAMAALRLKAPAEAEEIRSAVGMRFVLLYRHGG
jgi:hypothetical protein